MEVLLGIAAAVLVVWLVARSRHGETGAAATSVDDARPSVDTEARSTPLRVAIERAIDRDDARRTDLPGVKVTRSSDDHRPPAPSGGGVEAWSPRTQQVEVAGEWYRASNLRRLFDEHAVVSESGAEIRLPAVLVPDPGNPHDPHAVAVHVDGLHVGYLERPVARSYHRAISGLPGGELVCASRQWLRATSDDTWARVTLSLPQPTHLVCPNPPAGSCVVLPAGSTIQVTREEQHMEHLVPLLERFGSDTVLAATLRSVVEKRPRSTVDLVAVDINGQQVGVLSATQTVNFLPLVRRAEAVGRVVVCRATLRGNSLKADVALHARKVHELDEQELTALFEN